jgi:histidinol-phosphatase
MPSLDLSLALDTAIRAVQAASKASLRHFRADITIELKPDRSPVTQADKDAETAIVCVIRAAFPDHSLLTEESGALPGSPESRWIVDPLDGTRGFTRGGQFWGPLVALEHRGEIVAGAMAMPVLGETYWAARGEGAFRDGTRLRLSSQTEWTDATLSVGELSRMLRLPQAEQLESLLRSCTSVRGFGDVAACAMLLNGRADVWMEGGVQHWDLAPAQILIEEAGGRMTDFDGLTSPASGTALGANERLHAHALETLRSRR